jgi:hypothetical protein
MVLPQGCYIGQETLSKLNNVDGVKQQLWGLQLSQRAPPGAAIAAAGSGGAERVGVVTSVVNLLDSGHFGLGYIRCKSKGAQVDLNGEEGWLGSWGWRGWRGWRGCMPSVLACGVPRYTRQPRPPHRRKRPGACFALCPLLFSPAAVLARPPRPCTPPAGATVEVAGAPARVVPIPFATRSFAAGAEPVAAEASSSLKERAEQARCAGRGAPSTPALCGRAPREAAGRRAVRMHGQGAARLSAGAAPDPLSPCALPFVALNSPVHPTARRQEKEAAKAAAAAAKEQRLKAMQERLAAWQEQQKQEQ